jgi:hypothetical protein
MRNFKATLLSTVAHTAFDATASDATWKKFVRVIGVALMLTKHQLKHEANPHGPQSTY